MSTPARTIAVFGVYMLLTGFAFLFIPNTVLPLFGFQAAAEIWIRVLGLLVLIVGIYYLACAWYDVRPFIQITVFGRIVFCIGLVTLAFLDTASRMLILFGLIDLAGAVWTWLALRAPASSNVPARRGVHAKSLTPFSRKGEQNDDQSPGDSIL